MVSLDEHLREMWAQAPNEEWLDGVEVVGRPNRGLTDLIEAEEIDRDSIDTVLEIGAELGGSTRRFLTEFPNSKVVSVDPWGEGYVLPAWWAHLKAKAAESNNSLLPLFLAFNLPFQDRIIPIREFSSAGLIKAREFQIKPDIVYVDGDHTYHGVFTDLALANCLFPDAIILGDDWGFTSSYPRYRGIELSVQKAAKDFALHTSRELNVVDNNFAIRPVAAGTKVFA